MTDEMLGASTTATHTERYTGRFTLKKRSTNRLLSDEVHRGEKYHPLKACNASIRDHKDVVRI